MKFIAYAFQQNGGFLYHIDVILFNIEDAINIASKIKDWLGLKIT